MKKSTKCKVQTVSFVLFPNVNTLQRAARKVKNTEKRFCPWPFSLRPSAFSLIELLVVIVLIGIIAMLAAPDYLKFRQRVNLQSSVDLVLSGFKETFSLARSRSQHYVILAAQGSNYFEIRSCDDPTCTTTSVVPDNHQNPLRRELEGRTLMTSADFQVIIRAPHGDMEILSPAGADDFTLTLDNRGLIDDIHVYSFSGLVTTDK